MLGTGRAAETAEPNIFAYIESLSMVAVEFTAVVPTKRAVADWPFEVE